jgi:hypothetical protein
MPLAPPVMTAVLPSSLIKYPPHSIGRCAIVVEHMTGVIGHTIALFWLSSDRNDINHPF